jgi:hypothetical protein
MAAVSRKRKKERKKAESERTVKNVGLVCQTTASSASDGCRGENQDTCLICRPDVV